MRGWLQCGLVRDLVLVSAFIVGAQKSGTSALFSYLSDSADIQVAVDEKGAPFKEPHFFDNDAIDWSSPDYDMLHRLYRVDDGRIRLEATPIHSYWPNCIERIRVCNPSARIIAIFRDPVERAHSHWRMNIANGWETLPFSKAIREGRARMSGAPHRFYSYVERGFYRAQVERMKALFPEQCLILSAHELSSDPLTTVRAVTAFLGIKSPDAVTARRVFEGPSSAALVRADKDLLEDLLGDQRVVYEAAR